LIQTSWLKIWKGRSKGVSSVIGTVFLILIVFVISTNVFLWTISQSSIYNQAVKDVNQKNADKLNENIVASNASYSVPSPNKVKVDAKLTNTGSVSAQIINFWVFDPIIQKYNNTIVSLNLNPGDVLYLIGSKGINVTIVGASSADSFVAWFVTGRGNVVPVETAPPPEPEPEHLPINATGFFSLDWFYLKYTARYHTTPSDAAIVSKSYRYIAFYINVTNNGDEAMTIKSTCLIMLLIEWQEPLFYIVRSLSYSGGTPTITKYDDATPIIIGSHQSQILTFAAKSAAVTTWAWGSSLPVGIESGSIPEGGVVMTALVYTMYSQPTKTYAQSLSFRALVLGQ
jgi:FlaG/FlaF family flagellin (archaellin)